jgi:hypothetical protein
MVILAENGRPVLASSGGQITSFFETLEWGYRLAETPVGVSEGKAKSLWEATGWKEFVQHMPEYKRPIAAIMLENCRSRFGRLDEVTRTNSLGTFDKWIFPVIANMTENDVIDQLVAVQPMAGPVSQIVYMDIVTGRRKGRVPARAPMWRALQGAVDRFEDSDELIQDETGTANGSGVFVLEWTPVRAGTVTGNYDNSVNFADDGNGQIVDTSTGSVIGTITYQGTGAGTVTISEAANKSYTVTYAFNSENNLAIQEYEMATRSTPVTAKVYKLKTLWTQEAEQNLQAMYNIKAESVLLDALTSALQYHKHRKVIFDLRSKADAGFVVWDPTPMPNSNYQTHKFSLIDAFETASHMILGATNMVLGNWILMGLQPAQVVVTLPQFAAKNNSVNMQGVNYIGDLINKKVFIDPHYPINEFLVGHKGDQFLRTGYVLAEYQKLYTTPDIMLPDFTHQRGFATSFATKMINSKMYCRGAVMTMPTAYGQTIG